MKLLHVYIDFDPYGGGGGVARYINGLSSELVKQGFQIRIVAKDTLSHEGIFSVFRAGFRDLAKHVRWADVINIHGARKSYPAYAGLLALLLGRRVVYTPYCYYPEHSFNAKKIGKFIWDMSAERFLLSRCHSVILLTDYWREYLNRRHLSSTKTAVIPNCVTGADILTSQFNDQVQKLAGNPAILSVGRLDPVKRLDDVMAAMASEELKDAVFHIVGKGADRARLESKATHYGVSERVLFHGFVADSDVVTMARGADVFVLPSSSEGMPTVLIEMLLLGVPIACSRIPGNLAITDVLGLDCTFETGDIGGLLQVVLRHAGSAIPKRIIDLTVEKFTWEQTACKIAALYRGDRFEDA
jgi:glycosyltransferase involved in cell wall biosynthesis